MNIPRDIKHPPRIAQRLLSWFCASHWLEDVEGDLLEQYLAQANREGLFKARLTYWRDVLHYISRPYISRQPTPPYEQAKGPFMLSNYLKIAFRNLYKHKGYTIINVTGLAVGIACCVLIMMYVQDEFSYDQYHVHSDEIYRVMVGEDQEVTPTIVAPLFTREFPEVESATRLYYYGQFSPVVVGYEQHQFQESGFLFADSTTFDVFTHPFIAGTPQTALTRPRTLVLTESTARKYFGDKPALGELMQVGSSEYEVTGVIEDVPKNSHLTFDIIASFASTSWADREIWSSANFFTYVRLSDTNAATGLQRKIDVLLQGVREQSASEISNDYTLNLQPLTEIYLHYEGRITYVYLFLAIAGLILLIACINYMNLATARSAMRAREVGMRKTLGAYRGQLVRQFYGESAMLVAVALGLALVLTALLLPLFNVISNKALTLDLFEAPSRLLALLGIGALVSIIAGSYPALFLSSFRPARVLKGTFRTSTSASLLRKGLVVFQFAISVFLIVGTLVVYNQLDYVQSVKLGFDKEHVVVLPIGDRQTKENYVTLKNEFLQLPQVVSAAAVNSIPGYQRGGYALYAEGLELPEGEYFPIRGVPADKDVVETLGLELIAGAGFPQSEGYSEEQGYVYLLNETTIKKLGWTPEEAIGKWCDLQGGRRGEVVGVVRDFHHSSLHDQIDPLAFFIEPRSIQHLLVKITPDNVTATLATLEQTWQRLASHRPFEFRFLDQEFDALYRGEQQIGQLFTGFSILAILIACLGLFGLAAFAAEQRTKEIGVRKVLGASVPGIVLLLSKDFARLVLIAFVVAAPLSYLAMNRWLDSFAYSINVGVGTLVFAGVVALFIAFATVSYQSLKAALDDPIKSLRYE